MNLPGPALEIFQAVLEAFQVSGKVGGADAHVTIEGRREMVLGFTAFQEAAHPIASTLRGNRGEVLGRVNQITNHLSNRGAFGENYAQAARNVCFHPCWKNSLCNEMCDVSHQVRAAVVVEWDPHDEALQWGDMVKALQ